MTIISPLKLDPSRTTTLRAQFMKDMGRRFRALWVEIEKLVVEEDAFGLVPNKPLTFNTRWKFKSDDTKVKEFQRWFQEQVYSKILTVDNETGEPWTSKYVGSAHRTGVIRSFVEVNKDLLGEQSQFYAGSKAQFLRDAFNQPEVVSKVKLIYTRAYDELKGVTEKMGKDMSRVLAAGIARGANPREVARDLRREVDMSRERANRVARTEIIHAHAEGQLDGMEQLGVEEVGIQVEWSTAGDARVCQQCSGMEGTVLTVKEARGRIPLHPNCRCAWIPNIGRNLPSSRERLRKKVAKQAVQAPRFPKGTTS